MSTGTSQGEASGRVRGIDHVALPMRDGPGMAAFYRALGFDVTESSYLLQVHFGDQMINFHQPRVWERPDFTLRAPAAQPPCGDLCFVWEGNGASLGQLLEEAGADVIEGPVQRDGGRRITGVSVYVRDPDANLLEFIVYPEEEEHAG